MRKREELRMIPIVRLGDGDGGEMGALPELGRW